MRVGPSQASFQEASSDHRTLEVGHVRLLLLLLLAFGGDESSSLEVGRTRRSKGTMARAP